MSERHAFVMMIKEKWWIRFLRLNKAGRSNHSYVRKGSSPPKETELIFFYVVKPVGEIQGYADFRERRVGDTDAIWKEYGNESCLKSEDEYHDLVKGAENVSFIRFTNLHEAVNPIPLETIREYVDVSQLPRNGFYVSKELADKLIKRMG